MAAFREGWLTRLQNCAAEDGRTARQRWDSNLRIPGSVHVGRDRGKAQLLLATRVYAVRAGATREVV